MWIDIIRYLPLSVLRLLIGQIYYLLKPIFSLMVRILFIFITFLNILSPNNSEYTTKNQHNNKGNIDNNDEKIPNNNHFSIISYNISKGYDLYGNNNSNLINTFFDETTSDIILVQDASNNFKTTITKSYFVSWGGDNSSFIIGKKTPNIIKNYHFPKWLWRNQSKNLIWMTNILGIPIWIVNIHLSNDPTGLEQEYQLVQLKKRLTRLIGWKIIMGDFNYPFGDKIINLLGESFSEIKLEQLQNYSSFPYCRLDRVFISKGIDNVFNFSAEVIKVGYSKHFPIKLNISRMKII